MVVDNGNQPLIEALTLVAPGTALREGIDRVLQAQRGALIIVGDDAAVLSICSGGFLLDAEFSPQRLSEVAKMDGAIILAPDASRIARANVHLVPKASIPTRETGTRHRTAERVARSIDVPVIAVSESMSTIAIYRKDAKQTLQSISALLERAGQALTTLQRFRNHVDMALSALSMLEVEDAVSVRDVVAVLQPGELVQRIAADIGGYLVELGQDGRLIWLQLEELTAGVTDSIHLVVRDYVVLGDRRGQVAAVDNGHRGAGRHRPRERRDETVSSIRPTLHAADGEARPGEGVLDDDSSAALAGGVEAALGHLRALSHDDLLDPSRVADALGLGAGLAALDGAAEARGYRLLHRLPRFSDAVIDGIVERFTTLSRIMAASIGELEQVGGVGEAKARSVKDGLARLAEASILERYG